jgi:hypothetical protein
MRKLFGVLALAIPVLAFAGTAGTGRSAAVVGIPDSVAATVHVVRGTPSVVVTWVDTAATIVRSRIRRRSTGADTLWSMRGYTEGQAGRFEDAPVTFGKTYQYEVQDSVSGAALSAWSDSASVTVVKF